MVRSPQGKGAASGPGVREAPTAATANHWGGRFGQQADGPTDPDCPPVRQPRPGPDRPLTSEEESLVGALVAQGLAAIDALLLQTARERFRKVAWLVLRAWRQMEDRHPMLPEVF